MPTVDDYSADTGPLGECTGALACDETYTIDSVAYEEEFARTSISSPSWLTYD